MKRTLFPVVVSLILMLPLITSCHVQDSKKEMSGGGGSEVGNGGDPRDIIVQHGLSHAILLLPRLDAAQFDENFLPNVPSEHVSRFFREKDQMAMRLKSARIVEVTELPPSCPQHKFACYVADGNRVFVSYHRAPANLDVRSAAATFVHEAAHMLGEPGEAYANNAALVALETWRRMNHPEASHWFSMVESPLTQQTLQEDRLLLKHQYVDWTGTHLAVWTEGFLQKYDPKTNQWEMQKIKKNEVGWQRGGGARHLLRDKTQGQWVDGYGIIHPPCYRSFPKLAKDSSGVRLDETNLEWLPMTGEDAPRPRREFGMVKSSDAIWVWGGLECASPGTAFGDGGIYFPRVDKWEPIPSTLAHSPTPRYNHGMILESGKLFVWGGFGIDQKPGASGRAELLQDGGIYDVKAKQWVPIPVGPNAPRARSAPFLAWTGRELFVWGGFDDENGFSLSSGAAYDPKTQKWREMEKPPRALSYRILDPVFVFWTGSRIVIVTPKIVAQYDPISREWIDNGRAVVPDYYIYSRMFWTGLEGVLWNVEDRVGHLFYP